SAHIVRELIEQGYSIIAPDYRGSTGYGVAFYRQIDYGGWENDDVYAARNWMLESYDFLDPKRVGIVGWSHGGMITLMNIFEHPDAYACAYAGVPVSDLVARIGYKTDAYRSLFSAPYHIGKTPWEDVGEYMRRSPISHVDKLATPLLIHTNTSDEDVNVHEVERLIAALKAAGKKFEYKIYQNAPGGHAFNRIDTALARESRREIYEFLARYLKPGK
ncbi:MAG: alpha/beta hydrolase family protein, partial [Bryobacteraceae bacterium]